MKLLHLISSVLFFSQARAYLVSPPGAAAPGATAECSEWVQESYSLTCTIIEEFYGLTVAQFQAWVSFNSLFYRVVFLTSVEPVGHSTGSKLHFDLEPLLLCANRLCAYVYLGHQPPNIVSIVIYKHHIIFAYTDHNLDFINIKNFHNF